MCFCKNKTKDVFSSLNVSGKGTDKKSTVSFVADLFQNRSCTMAEREEMEDEGWALAHETFRRLILKLYELSGTLNHNFLKDVW